MRIGDNRNHAHDVLEKELREVRGAISAAQCEADLLSARIKRLKKQEDGMMQAMNDIQTASNRES